MAPLPPAGAGREALLSRLWPVAEAMKSTSPPHEQKLEFHRLRAEGKFPGGLEGWRLYLEWRGKPKKELVPRKPVDTVSLDDYEPPPTPQEELGF